MPFWTTRRVLGWTAAALSLIILWDASGLDLPFARLFGTAEGFPLRGNKAFVMAFHEIPRTVSSLVVVALIVGVFRPWLFLSRLARRDRVQLVVSVLGAMLLITLLKKMNTSSCPWDVNEFGGVASYVSHWALGVRDMGPGHCFPAGHASSAFGFLAGWFVIRRTAPEMATRWLAVTIALGLVLGLAQQLRGAHYMSHTLWTGFFCWTAGLLTEWACRAWVQRKPVSLATASKEELQP